MNEVNASVDRLVLTVGEYYKLMSRCAIPRTVKLRWLSECGRYAEITFSCSGKKRHKVLAKDLLPGR